MGGTFVLQSATGFIIELWPQADGRYPGEAHQAALVIGLTLQLATLLWFAAPRHLPLPSMHHAVVRMALAARPPPITASWPYAIPIAAGSAQIALAQRQVVRWRRAAAASASLCLALTTVLVVLLAREHVPLHVVEAGLRRVMGTDQALAQPALVRFTSDGPAEDRDAAKVACQQDVSPAMSKPQSSRIASIIRLRKDGKSYTEIAARFDITPVRVRHIFEGFRRDERQRATSSRSMEHDRGLRRFPTARRLKCSYSAMARCTAGPRVSATSRIPPRIP